MSSEAAGRCGRPMPGTQLAPLLADAGSATLYRVDAGTDYGPLQGLIRARVNTAIIVDHWDDLLRVAGSLLTSAVKPAELLRYLVGSGHPTPVGRALIELGKLDRSADLATYFDDQLLRRRVGTQSRRPLILASHPRFGLVTASGMTLRLIPTADRRLRRRSPPL